MNHPNTESNTTPASKTSSYRLRGRFWISSEEGTFLGTGRVMLLERIEEFGSISAAARSMKMSYRQAWQLVHSMNTHSDTPLVTSSKGGKGGGGAHLTDTGKRAIQLFRNVEQDMREFMAQRSAGITL